MANGNRGLASASDRTKKRVAKMGGESKKRRGSQSGNDKGRQSGGGGNQQRGGNNKGESILEKVDVFGIFDEEQ